MKSGLPNNAESFTPTEDVTETTEDGRTIQVAVKGVPMPIAEAKRLGLVEGEEPQPSSAEEYNRRIAEKRGQAPDGEKAIGPAANKSATTAGKTK